MKSKEFKKSKGKIDVFVYRLKYFDEKRKKFCFGIAKPCIDCAIKMHKSNKIRYVYYTTSENTVEKKHINDLIIDDLVVCRRIHNA
jgi:hypothetical protein